MTWRETFTRALAVCVLCLGPATGAHAQEAAAPACAKPFPRVYLDTAPSVARVLALKVDPFRLVNRVERNIGAAVFISDTRLVTNAHTIWDASAIGVEANDTSRGADIVGADPITDIAVLEIESAIPGTAAVNWGDSDRLAIGEDVMAIGHPAALTSSATRGIISGTSRVLPISPMSWLTPLIQTDAAVFPGNSGGPLVNRCGEVVGINTLVIEGRAGINFALPSNQVKTVAAELQKHNRVVRPWHGIHGRVVDATLGPILELAHGTDIRGGFLVETVEPGSPAEKAGVVGGLVPVKVDIEEYLIGGDIITHVNGTLLDTMDTVVGIARSLKVGDTLEIRLLRGDKQHTIEVELPERPILQGDVRRFKN